LSAVAAVFVLVSPLPGQTDSAVIRQPSPLFTAHDVLELTIHAPFKTIFKERKQESSYHPAVMQYPTEDGSVDSVEIRVKTRGKFRLQRRTCNFPPIRVDLPRKELEGTVFEGQNRLKVVTHCQNGRQEYEQQVILEHLTYQIFTLLTERSFRTRLARITYIDTEEDDDPLTRYAFFIEDEQMMAERNGWQLLETDQVPPWNYDQGALTLVEVFQYMVANTDWDGFKKAQDQEICCHNLRVIGDPAGPVLPVPYDFDWTGLVDRRYAKPDPSLRIRSVRQRVYRGVCRAEEELAAALPIFNEKKAAIYALFQTQAGLEPKFVEESIEYLDEFYEVIDDPGKVKSRMLRDCRRVGG
jgi:hypothetical protein